MKTVNPSYTTSSFLIILFWWICHNVIVNYYNQFFFADYLVIAAYLLFVYFCCVNIFFFDIVSLETCSCILSLFTNTFQDKWSTVFKNGPSKICGKQSLKKFEVNTLSQTQIRIIKKLSVDLHRYFRNSRLEGVL